MIRTTLAAALAVFLVMATAHADDRPVLIPGKTVLRLSQKAGTDVVEDRLRVELSAEASGTDTKEVQGELNQQLQAAMQRVRGNVGITVANGPYSIYREPTRPPGPWRATGSFFLTSADFSTLASDVGDLEAQGLLLTSAYFFVAPETAKAAEDSLTIQATQGLRDRAQKMAQALGQKVESIGEIEVGNDDAPSGRPIPYMKAAVPTATGTAPPLQPGVTTISVTVSAIVVLSGGPGSP